MQKNVERENETPELLLSVAGFGALCAGLNADYFDQAHSLFLCAPLPLLPALGSVPQLSKQP